MKKMIAILLIALCAFIGISGCNKESAPNDITDTPALSEPDSFEPTARVIPPEGDDYLTFEFNTRDIDGNLVDSSVFGDYEITMVNIWATWCGPCVYEMPFIAETYGQLPEGANIITICTDVLEDVSILETAQEILQDAEAGFKTLLVDESLSQLIGNNVTAYPTTYFVNSLGQTIGEPQVGLPQNLQDIPGEYLKTINGRMGK